MNIFRLFLKQKTYENMLQNAPNCTIQNFFLGEACPRTPLANVWLRYVRTAPPPKLAHLGKS